MSTNINPPCSLQSRGHVMNFPQLKLAVGRWRREGVFCFGHVLDANGGDVELGTDGGVLLLHHHRTTTLRHVIGLYGAEAALLSEGVLVLLGAQQGTGFSSGATFSVAGPEQRDVCRTDFRPGDNHGPAVF